MNLKNLQNAYDSLDVISEEIDIEFYLHEDYIEITKIDKDHINMIEYVCCVNKVNVIHENGLFIIHMDDQLEIRIEPELKKAAQDKAEKDGVKLSQLIVKLLKEYLR